MIKEPTISKLSTTQLTILVAACARDDGLAVRPETLKPPGAAKILAKLIEQGLVREQRAKGDMPVWREDEHGKALSLKILKAGRAAVEAMAPASESGGLADGCCDKGDGASAGTVAQPLPVTNAVIAKPGSRRALLLALLSREDGATIAVMMAATGWLPHITRAALSGLRKSGLAIARSRNDQGGPSVYRIGTTTDAAAA